MHTSLKIFTLVLLFSLPGFSQSINKEYFKENLEVYFEFNINDRSELDALTRIISIDNVIKNTVRAYANEEEWSNFIRKNYSYKILPHPGDVGDMKMSNGLGLLGTWDSYPTYDGYVSLMNQFAALYPSICRIVDAGNTVNGRKILFAVISDNVGVREAEPQFMFTSTIHGDETTGYVLMLRLIDSLLTSYGSDPRITNLVNNVEIWINPDANPDGTYYGGNNTVNNARRYNANGKDLNRNFPDPYAGPYPTGAWQPETIVMMSLADSNRFVHSANFHGGAEVVNYPWDCFSRLHPDNDWYYQISRKFADTVHANSPAGYMTDLNNGITNGYAWYAVYGGRQDYYTYFKKGRETTIEISSTKLLNPSLLPAHWNYLKRSFLSYIENCLYGLRGIVTDSIGHPLKAKITIAGHDYDSTEVITDFRNGNYHRMIAPGTYNITFSADSFYSKTINNVTVLLNNTTVLDVQLSRMYVPVELVSFTAEADADNVLLRWKTATELNNSGFEVQRKKEPGGWETISLVKGNSTTSIPCEYSFIDMDPGSGHLSYRLAQIDFDGTINYSAGISIDLNPVEFSLYQNYPNPFNPSTTIKYSLKEAAVVIIKVFDVLGNEAAVLVNEKQGAGLHELSFDASGLSSGIYLIKLYARDGIGANFESVKKINFIK